MPKVVPAKSGPTRPLLACQKWTLDHFWLTKTGPTLPKPVLVPIRLESQLLALYSYLEHSYIESSNLIGQLEVSKIT